ncbi:MAG: N-acetylmuramoyl-L-alanine amidase [Oscillospiraceae bacterium]
MKRNIFLKKSIIDICAMAVTAMALSFPCSADTIDMEAPPQPVPSPYEFFSMIKSEPQEIAEQQQGLKGDVNGDGIINEKDILGIKNIIYGYNQTNEHSDMNDDGITDIYDLIILKNIMVYKEIEDDVKKICLDPGHYGSYYNPSPGVEGYYESNMTWQLHLYLKEELETYGFEVITTRENKADDRSLVSRGQASANCNLFLSIHSNAVGSAMNEDIDFPVAIVLLPDDSTDIDDISMAIGKKLTATVADTMETKQPGSVWTRLSEEDRNEDGIMNDEWYGVLFGAKSVGTPAILMEHSFHTNTRSALWLMQDTNLRKLAQAEAKTLAEYFELI